MREEEKTCNATHDEICDGALKHYEELSKLGHSWLSTIPQAIEFYRKHYKQINDQKTREVIDSVLPDEPAMKKILDIAMERESTCSIQYFDYDENQWTTPSLLTKDRIHRILCDGSIRKIQINYEN